MSNVIDLTGTVAMSGEEIAKLHSELRTLRLIVTEKFAGADLYVKPEDAADLAKWAANPQHVRELLKLDPYRPAMIDGADGEYCWACYATDSAAHHPTCAVAAAWRALGDPRGAEDIERAHEEALREQARRVVVFDETVNFNAAQWEALRDATNPFVQAGRAAFHQTGGTSLPERPFRLASESQAAAQARELEAARELNHELLGRLGAAINDRDGVRARSIVDDTSGPNMARDFEGVRVQLDDERLDPDEYRLNREDNLVRFGARAWLRFHRSASDARGMEAVEFEARAMNWQAVFAATP